MKRLLNDSQQKTIADAVAHAEKRTRAEIVTVLAPASDDYRIYGLLWGIATALLLGAGISGLEFAWAAPLWLDFLPLLMLLLAIVLARLLQVPALLRLLVPRRLLQRRASAMARVQFLAQELHHTREESGVLLFVSEFERHVEILVDRGVARHIPDSQWKIIVDQFTAQVKAGQVEAGFVNAINQCSEKLAAALPPADDNPNELPNRLIILD